MFTFIRMPKKKNIIYPSWDFNIHFAANNYWLPLDDNLTNTDCFLQNKPSNSWFPIYYYKSKCPSNLKLNTDVNSPNQIIRYKKIELFPNLKQQKVIKRFLDLYRLVYNKTVTYIRTHDDSPKTDFYKLRKIVKPILDEYIKKQLPEHLIDQSIHDVCKAYKTCFELIKNKRIKYFNIHHKNKNNDKQTMAIEACFFPYYNYLLGIKHKSKKNVNYKPKPYKPKNTFLSNHLGKEIRSAEPITHIDADCRLTYYQKINRYYLYIPIERKMYDKIDNKKEFNILDPGVRTFQTGYSNEGIIEYGSNIFSKLDKTLFQIDKIKSKMETADNKKKEKLKKGKIKREKKIKDLVDELHYKTINTLCKNYKTIVIGKLNTQNILDNETSNLSKMNKRRLQTLSHYKFRQRLIEKAEMYGVKVTVVSERLTSKTCGRCGYINRKLKGEHEFTCPTCKLKIHRDYNSARLIMIKNMKSI